MCRDAMTEMRRGKILLPWRETGSGRWGYASRLARGWAIPPRYEGASFFSDGMAAVRLEGLRGYITGAGIIAIRPQFRDAEDFDSGCAVVHDGAAYGVIDRSGKAVLPFSFDFIFQDYGYPFPAFATHEDGGKWGVRNLAGETLVPFLFDDLNGFDEHGWALAQLDGRNVFIDRAGKTVLGFESCGNIRMPFSDGLAVVERNGREGCVDRSGRIVLPAVYDEVSAFSEELIPVRDGTEWFYIDEYGRRPFRTVFDNAVPFENGFAFVEKGGAWGVIDHRGAYALKPDISDFGPSCLGFVRLFRGDEMSYFDTVQGKEIFLRGLTKGIFV